jgi:TorA-specific chaperone
MRTKKRGTLSVPESSIADARLQLLLNCLELATAIFHGPDRTGWEALITTGLPQLLAQAPEADPDLIPALRKLQSALPGPQATGDPLTDLETEYVRLFIAGRGGAVAPPYQSCHQNHPARVMGDTAQAMQRRLNNLGLELALDSNEPPDHLAIELEYLYHLLATAWTQNDPATEFRARAFARNTLGDWLPRFRQALADGDGHDAYVAAVDLVAAVIGKLA